MAVTTIYTAKAPEPIGPYSQAKLVDGTLYISGQIGLDPVTGRLAGDDIKAQTEQVMSNLDAILTAAGKSFDDVVKTTCLLTDMSAFATFNEIYEQYAVSRPVRSTYAVKALPANALVEVELVAD
ncbi:Rid family detoxifying hydrolase [Lacticaseibacillus camelliae]|uniref:Uncharacterized protein n=1 Tax=Lacticaseibacillus camelliae DSM 22697 = JCM 13995 TaxID=1423730 RepID=A0A0R2FJF4_9LACO|nr:Rid family detoxifying hydrolase [Lacticaseibacillus camelliae]KRN25207.1 hypothetical protein FC75_GL000887 [Lacticaseibacillus camelliae DSM 22697 = JCM 13995]